MIRRTVDVPPTTNHAVDTRIMETTPAFQAVKVRDMQDSRGGAPGARFPDVTNDIGGNDECQIRMQLGVATRFVNATSQNSTAHGRVRLPRQHVLKSPLAFPFVALVTLEPSTDCFRAGLHGCCMPPPRACVIPKICTVLKKKTPML